MTLLGIVLTLTWVGLHAALCPAPAAEAPHISGVITDVRQADGGGGDLVGRVLIEGRGQYDRASVAVKSSTRLSRQEKGRIRPADFGELKVGSRVRAWFAGPVAESYPVQATAREILILEDGESGRASQGRPLPASSGLGL